MKSRNFFANNTIIQSHLKNNWKIILFFTLSFLLTCCLIALLFGIGSNKIYIAPTILEIREHGHPSKSYVPSISMMVVDGILSIPGIIFFGIVSITMIGITFSSEFKTGQITLWMTSPMSRIKIFTSKILFIWSVLLIIFAPSVIVIITMTGMAEDSGEYMGKMIFNIFAFIFFILLLSTILSVISVSLSNNPQLGLTLNCLVITYIVLTYILIIVGGMIPKLDWMKNIKYISIQSTLLSPLHFGLVPDDGYNLEIGGLQYISASLIYVNKGLLYSFPVINIAGTIGFLALGNYSFSIKNLNI